MAVIIRSAQTAAITTGGPTQDFAVSGGFTGNNPKGALVFFTPGVTAGTQVDNARISIGFTDGTTSRCVSFRSRHGQASSSTVRNGFNDRVGWVYQTGTSTTATDGHLVHSSFGADKWTGSWSTLPPAAFLINTVLFGGSDCDVFVGESTSSATLDAAGETDVTGPGWTPDLIFFICRGSDGYGGTSQNHANITFGVAINIGGTWTQGSLCFMDHNAELTAQSCSAILRDDRCIKVITNGEAEGVGLIVSATHASGFKVQTKDSGVALPFAYMAMRFNGKVTGLDLRTRTTRTSNGTDTFSSLAFTSQAQISVFSLLSAVNTLASNSEAGGFGLGVMTGASEEFSSAIISEDAAATSNTGSVTHNIGLHMPLHDGTAGPECDLTAFTSTGATYNYTATNATARQFLLLSIGETPKITGESRAVGRGLSYNTPKIKAELQTKSKAASITSFAPKIRLQAWAQTISAGKSNTAPKITLKGLARSISGSLCSLAGKVKYEAALKTLLGAITKAQGSIVAASKVFGEARSLARALLSSKPKLTIRPEARVVGVSKSTNAATIKLKGVSAAKGSLLSTNAAKIKLEADIKAKATAVTSNMAKVRLGGKSTAKGSGLSSTSARLRNSVKSTALGKALSSSQSRLRAQGQARSISGSLVPTASSLRLEGQGKAIGAGKSSLVARTKIRAQLTTKTSGLAKGFLTLVVVTTKQAEALAIGAIKSYATARIRSKPAIRVIASGKETTSVKLKLRSEIRTKAGPVESVQARIRLSGKAQTVATAKSFTPLYRKLINQAKALASGLASVKLGVKSRISSLSNVGAKTKSEAKIKSKIVTVILAGAKATSIVRRLVRASIRGLGRAIGRYEPIAPRITDRVDIIVVRQIEIYSIIRSRSSIPVSRTKQEIVVLDD